MDTGTIIFLIFTIIMILFAVYGTIIKKESQKARSKLKEEDLIKEIDKIETLTANEIEEKLGVIDHSVLSYILQTMRYIGGIDDVDEKTYISTEIRLKGLEIKFLKMRFGLLSGNVKYWTVENRNELIGSKSKSVIGRALAGGLIFGPVGAIVGGLTGLGKKSLYADDIENLISFCYNEGENERMILFQCKDMYLKKTFNSLKQSSFGNRFKSPSELVKLEHTESTETVSQLSVADELKKLKELLDEGLLTKEEFEKQKEKLLK